MDDQRPQYEPGEVEPTEDHPTTDGPYEVSLDDDVWRGDHSDLAAPRREEKRLSRRRFLEMAAWSAIGALAAQMGLFRGASANNLLPPPTLQPSYVAYVRRRNDLLDLRIAFYNMKRVAQQGGGSVMQRINPNQNAFMVVHFPPQATAERAFAMNQNPFAPLGVGQWANAGESRLAFEIPPSVESIPYTTASLLMWNNLVPRLVPAALPRGASPSPYPGVRAPASTETAIEMPWRLFLSPHSGLGWAHALNTVTRNGRTEIWHTRLGVRSGNTIDEWSATDRTVRAIWTKDNVFKLPNFVTLATQSTVTPQQRIWMVEATADKTKVTSGNPEPVQVNRLMLTPLGGWLDIEGSWENHPSLLAWRHLATMGRDHYVRIVEKGFLFPFGHPAAKLTISERRFEQIDGQVGGILRKETFIVVRHPTKSYVNAVGQPFGGRAWPFPSLTFKTLMTPSLILQNFAGGELPTVDGDPFLFSLTGKDREGRDVSFNAPAVFVPAATAFDQAAMSALANHYNSQDLAGVLRQRVLNGQKVALADPDKPGDTTVDMASLVLGANPSEQGMARAQLAAAEQPAFFPALTEFRARLNAVEEATGADLADLARMHLGPYIEEGFGTGNPGNIFAVILGAAQDAGFGADKAGGLVTPNLDVTSLSRLLGAVGGDPVKMALGEFDPADFFKAGVAKLLGGIDLADIIKAVNFAAPGNLGKALKITTRPILGDDLQSPVKIITEVDWKPDLKGDPLGLFEPDENDGSLTIKAEFVVDILNPGNSTYDVDGDLKKFKLNLVGNSLTFMSVGFDQLHFTAKTGQKTNLKPVVSEVAFTGPLEFVNRIKDFLTFGGSGPYIDPTPTGLTVGYNLPLPQIPLGQVIISQISLGASLFIPWSGDPARVRFNLSSREKPFNITYTAIGGGGFLGIAFGLDGLEKFEASLELGAYLSVDFGVASGSISIAAGIYFAIEKKQVDGKDVTTVGLDAYLRFVGKAQALKIVSISLEIYLSLGFQTPPPALIGTAKVELQVKVLFLSISVKISVQRKIAGSSNAAARSLSVDESIPTFVDLYDEAHWLEYAEAFA